MYSRVSFLIEWLWFRFISPPLSPPSRMTLFIWEYKNKGIIWDWLIHLMAESSGLKGTRNRFEVGLGAGNWGSRLFLLNMVIKESHLAVWFALCQAWCGTLYLISSPPWPPPCPHNPPTPKAVVNCIKLHEIFVPRKYLSFPESSLISAFRETFTQPWNFSLLSLLNHTILEGTSCYVLCKWSAGQTEFLIEMEFMHQLLQR